MFLLNSSSLLVIIVYSEIVWIILYSYAATMGITNDDLLITSTAFFLLALAGLEFCIGFLITIFYRNFKKSFNLDIFIKFSTKNLRKLLYSNKYI
jgi:hypothetical protein